MTPRTSAPSHHLVRWRPRQRCPRRQSQLSVLLRLALHEPVPARAHAAGRDAFDLRRVPDRPEVSPGPL